MGKKTAAATKEKPAILTIQQLTEDYATKHRILSNRVEAQQNQIAAVMTKHSAGIDEAVQDAVDAKERIEEAVKRNRSEFVKPKTRKFFGFTVGLKKLIGKLTFDDPVKVIDRIKKKYSVDQQRLLIRTVEEPNKEALEKLSGVELKALGCTIGEDTDVPVVRPPKSDMQRLIDSLLKTKGEE
jgi:hypothetical protein